MDEFTANDRYLTSHPTAGRMFSYLNTKYYVIYERPAFNLRACLQIINIGTVYTTPERD